MPGAGARSTSRERVVLAVLALYLTAALMLLTPIRGALGGPAGTAPLPPPPAAAADPQAGAAAPGPELAADQQQRAQQILAADRSLAAALAGTPHAVVKSGPWTTSGTDGGPSRLLGAAFVIAPQRPLQLRSVPLPGALYDQTERRTPPYQAVVNRVSGREVSELFVLVDLERGRVVNTTPGPGTRDFSAEPPPRFRRTVPAPRDGGR